MGGDCDSKNGRYGFDCEAYMTCKCCGKEFKPKNPVHRLMCGDSTKHEDVERVMDGKKAQLMVTDPPYGISYADKNAFLNAVGRGNRIQTPIEGDHSTAEQMSDFWKLSFTASRSSMAIGASYYVTGPQGGDLLLLLLLALRESGFPLRHMLVWVKNNHVLGRCDYHYKHEPIIFGWVEGTHLWNGGNSEISTWEIDRSHVSDLHPTMKPVELCARAIRNSSNQGDIVFDPFLGSGPTIVATEQLNRICYGIEIHPRYVAVCLERMSTMGLKPRLLNPPKSKSAIRRKAKNLSSKSEKSNSSQSVQAEPDL